MKKIKCQLCDGAWIVEEEDLERQKVCPYCGTSVRGKVEFETYDSLDKAIYGAVTKMGDGVLQNLRQLSGFMMDTAPNLKKEIRIFSKTISDDYVIHIKTLFAQDIDEVEVTIKKLRQLFIEEEGLSDAWADMICEGLYGATMYYNGKGMTQMVNVTVEDIPAFNSTQQLAFFPSQHDIKTVNVKIHDDAENEDPKSKNNEDDYNILEHYKCSVCGYVIDGYDLKYRESKDCPICRAFRWEITSDELSSQSQPVSSPTRVSNTYNAEPFRNILSHAEEMLAANDIEAALEKYRMAANGGYVPAYNSIAAIYYSKQNFKKAWKWYLKAAEANDSEGQYHVGLFYLNGLYVKKSTHMAIKYFVKSADQNNNEALLTLADLYISENECEKDEQSAIKFLTSAAENGYAEAQLRLGQFYQSGNVVSKDTMKAAHWYLQAMRQGHPRAKKKLDECISEMSLTQRLKWKLQ